jgi:Protein of unknown function (DUF3071)
MRELKVVGLDVDGKHLLCEEQNSTAQFRVRVDERLRAAVRGDAARANQTHIEVDAKTALRPKDIQARIRAGSSVEELAQATGVEVSRIERFASPILLERACAAEFATAAHPVLHDGPSVLTLRETVTSALVTRGLNSDATSWDAWRGNDDPRWTVQLSWKAGRSDNVAHFRFTPGAHGGIVIAIDESASELIDPNFERPLRPVAPVAQLDFGIPDTEVPVVPAPDPHPEPVEAEAKAQPPAQPVRSKRVKPTVPAWEDVLLGVRSSGDR